MSLIRFPIAMPKEVQDRISNVSASAAHTEADKAVQDQARKFARLNARATELDELDQFYRDMDEKFRIGLIALAVGMLIGFVIGLLA